MTLMAQIICRHENITCDFVLWKTFYNHPKEFHRIMEKQFGPGAILYFRRLKAALDHNNLLNPGKLIGG